MLLAQRARHYERFIITGKVTGVRSGKIALYFKNYENKWSRDTIDVRNGQFNYSGKINRVSDAHLWTDLNNKNFSDKSVIRFLLQPGIITISYTQNEADKHVVTGASVQTEKLNWDLQKKNLYLQREMYIRSADSIAKVFQLYKDSVAYENALKHVNNKFKFVFSSIEKLDIGYIKAYKNSYVSGFLLSNLKRKLPIDTVIKLYTGLGGRVKNSQLGVDILEYVYPLTDNLNFREKNPVFGKEYNEQLQKISSV